MYRTMATVLCLCSVAFAREPGQALFLKSLLIPGWGQYEAGRTKHALAFLGVDLLLIGSALSLHHHGSQLRDDYKAFASTHARVRGDHNREFYIDVANWMSVYDYNDQRMSERNFGAVYDTDSQYWMWDSEASRSYMDELRLTSDRSLNRVIYAVALIGVNHIVSAFHAGRLQSNAAKSETGHFGWNAHPVTTSDGGKLQFLLWW